ncbi:hypothetical protein [Telluribacter sp. SYSU D00476]|uniref:hypothetical protein n=1 Tax=Telluribacter sp. SYSU D00476 TaxID=2811430 RepID=UPI001FF1F3AC|nr:hypothetical protein [Telluribacter sp. SYSU D00476]
MKILLIISIVVSLTVQLMGTFIGAIYAVWFLMLLVALIGTFEDNKLSWLLSSILLLLLMHPLIQDPSDSKYSIGIILAVVLSILYVNISQRVHHMRTQEEHDHHDTLFSFSVDEISYLINNNNPTLFSNDESEELAEYTKEIETGKMDFSTLRGITIFCAICVSIYIFHNGVGLGILGPLLMILVLSLFTYIIHTCNNSYSKDYNLIYMQLMEEAKQRASQFIHSKKR